MRRFVCLIFRIGDDLLGMIGNGAKGGVGSCGIV